MSEVYIKKSDALNAVNENTPKYDSPLVALNAHNIYYDIDRIDGEPMVPLSKVEKIKSKIVEEGAFYKEIGEQDKVDAFSVALNIIDFCMKEEVSNDNS